MFYFRLQLLTIERGECYTARKKANQSEKHSHGLSIVGGKQCMKSQRLFRISVNKIFRFRLLSGWIYRIRESENTTVIDRCVLKKKLCYSSRLSITSQFIQRIQQKFILCVFQTRFSLFFHTFLFLYLSMLALTCQIVWMSSVADSLVMLILNFNDFQLLWSMLALTFVTFINRKIFIAISTFQRHCNASWNVPTSRYLWLSFHWLHST